ncbi:hypothetical protein HU200_024930 [Digitaria exilis]|uniref:DUF7597 domain-containing protein n=1 Tax=Digitaria exilis TaxID=1010633 RepID=A0A835BXS2_9POAL|nr:hypothetical protein HU200_024930 [Digitaria exilis]
MANFAIDPHPHVPRGFEVLPRDPNAPPTRLHTYIGGVLEAHNEDLAVAFLLPAMAKEDFRELVEALKHLFAQDQPVHLLAVQLSPIDDAYVWFGSPVERERFLDRVIQFGHGYTLWFIKHDEGLHVREHPLDREVWLMMMLFPNDARTNSAIAKAVAGFGLLRYWWMGMDGSQDDNSAGHAASHSAHGPSADDVMSKDPAGNGGDNEQVDIGAAEEVSGHGQVNISAADEVSGHGHQINQDATENEDIMPQLSVVPVNSAPVMSVDAVFPVLHPNAPLIPPGFDHVQIQVNSSCPYLFGSLITTPFRYMRHFLVNLDTIVPSYVSDHDLRFYLASIAADLDAQAARGPSFIGPLPMPLVPYSSSNDDSVVEVSSPPTRSSTCKRHRCLLKEPLDDAFLRRSAQLQ